MSLVYFGLCYLEATSVGNNRWDFQTYDFETLGTDGSEPLSVTHPWCETGVWNRDPHLFSGIDRWEITKDGVLLIDGKKRPAMGELDIYSLDELAREYTLTIERGMVTKVEPKRKDPERKTNGKETENSNAPGADGLT